MLNSNGEICETLMLMHAQSFAGISQMAILELNPKAIIYKISCITT
jgi:hypothetical protein